MLLRRAFLRIPAELRGNPEFQSAVVRIGVWTFGVSYLSLATVTGYYRVDVPYLLAVIGVFTVVYLGILVSVLRRPHWPARRYVALSLDILVATLGIFLTHEGISPFYLLYIWIFISAGTRYGTRHLVLASVEAVVAYSLVLYVLDQWSRYPYEAVFFLLLLVLLPLYQYALLRRVQRATEEAERANKAKGDFLAFMTHELRTPLTGVIGMTELMKTTRLDPEQGDFVHAISNSATVLNALIGDILDFSKIDAARLKLEQIPFEPRQVVREVCGVLEGPALAQGLELICRVAPEVPRSVVGDQLRVRQILFNLVGNAVKFTAQGHVELRLSVRPPEDGLGQPHLLVEIEDTGIGIPPDKLTRIFDSFSQADDSTTRRFGGSGLGTTIARELALLMGGLIGVDSGLGEGSRFWVRLPLLGGQMPAVPPPAGRLAGRRALVLERNPVQLGLIRAALVHEGMECLGLAGPEVLTGPVPTPDLLLIADHPQGADLKGLRAGLESRLGAARPCLYLVYGARRPDGGLDGCPSLAKPFLAEDLIGALESLLGLAPAAVSDDPSARGFGGATAAASAGIRVLVAEDNEVAAKVITTFLKKMGFEYTRVQDGEAALREALAGGYGIAIVDLRMPKLDGMELARRYRQEAPDRPLPIVALTANASDDVKQDCLAAGMDGFLSKPVSPEVLRETLERLAVRG
jgi:two-component system, sensor histidine kinase RpfC